MISNLPNYALHFLCSLIGLIFFHIGANGQTPLTKQAISISFTEAPLLEIITELEKVCVCNIYHTAPDRKIRNYTGSFQEQSIEELLEIILENTALSFISYDDQILVIGERSEIETLPPPQFYQALEENLEILAEPQPLMEVIGRIEDVSYNSESKIRGKVIDRETGEGIEGVSILNKNTGSGTTTSQNGVYELDMEAGSYELTVHYIGYRKREIPIRVISSGSLDISLIKGDVQLDEIVLEAYASDENVQSNQTGLIRVSIKEIERLPSFLGEVDVVKSLLLQPGVSTMGEGSSGFHVRGGNVDQNLILLDEAMLFNSSHALGFFSTFNSDIIQDATLYKGNIPAKYGGRISSVLDVGIREGDQEKIKLKGGLGIVSSRFMIEGPITKNKTSFLVSGRSTYSDFLLNAIKIPEVKASSAFFYDANIRLTHRFNERNILSLSTYQSKDKFVYNNQFGFDYQTSIAQLSYRRIIGKQYLSTFHAIYGNYQSNQEDLRPSIGSTLGVGNAYWKGKENINFSREGFTADAGLSAILYKVNPGLLKPNGPNSAIREKEVEQEKGLELAAYLSATYDLSTRVSINGGLRYTFFQYLGPRNIFVYQNPDQPREGEIIGRENIGANRIFEEGRLEPRISIRYKLDAESSLKFGYTRSSQFINQISNTETPLPTNIWQLSNQYIPPHLSHNFSFGYFRNFDQNNWITSLDVFYRFIDQLFDYKDFADLVSNEHIETELRRGIGRSRGLELSLKKQVGFVHGWLSYTYSRTERKLSAVNEGAWYPSAFDKPHEISLVTNIQVSKRNTISVNFNYASGRPITIPVDKHLIDNRLIVLNYSLRNAFRIPDYHRLDIAYTLSKGFRKSQKFKTSWTLSIYNVYSRKNAFAVFVDQAIVGKPKIKRLSVLGSAFPSLTINFELL